MSSDQAASDRSGAASRARAARILAAVLEDDRALPEALEHAGTGDDAGFVRELCYGTCRWFFALERLTSARLRAPLRGKDADVLALLLMGIYQLGWMRLPDRAAVHATVAATTVLGKPWATKLVNAVLRGIQRDAGDDGVMALALADSVEDRLDLLPPWLSERLRDAYPEHCVQLGAAFAARPPMTLRVCAAADRAAVLSALLDAGMPAHEGTLSNQAAYLDSPAAVEGVPGFADGTVSVQDEAAQLAAPLLAPRAGERVLDACAAPGGKTGHLLELAPEATVVALDVDARRCQLITDNLQRLGRSAQVLCADVRDVEKWWDGELFDAILLDAPCSATGILRRQPDVRLLRAESDIAILAALQRQMLEALWPLLRPGGRLIYVTCSVLPEENGEVIQAFCAAHADARCDTFDAPWGLATACGRQLLPTADAHDGFYFARLQRLPETPAP